jgi:ferritin-like metal-binding protein YciE
MDSLSELLEEQLKDLYSAENQMLKSLPRMAKAASSPELRMSFERHTEETRIHVERLAKVAETLGVKPTGKVCKAMQGLIEEGKEALEEEGEDTILDAGLIAAAQRMEHYEIAAYGTVKSLATVLGQQEVVDLFEETLNEEKTTDELLTQCAERDIYPGAPKNEGDGSMGGEEDGQSSGGGSSGKGKSSGRSSGGKSGGKSGGASSSKAKGSTGGAKSSKKSSGGSKGKSSSGARSKSR